MMWRILMERMRDHLESAMQSTPVSLNADGHTPNTRAVIIKRGRVPLFRPHETRQGTTELLIECWEYDDDFEAANVLLDELLTEVIAELEAFIQAQSADNDLALSITLVLDPDGDLFRPAIASQLTATIDWRLLT